MRWAGRVARIGERRGTERVGKHRGKGPLEDLRFCGRTILTLILLTWRIWRAPNNASRWEMGFNSAFKGLKWILKISVRGHGQG